MRRRSLPVILLIMIMLSGCARDPEAVRSRTELPFGMSQALPPAQAADENETADADENETADAAENETADAGDNTADNAAGNTAPESVAEFYETYEDDSDEIQGVSADMMNCCFDSFLTWAGLRYFYDNGEFGLDGLEVQNAVQIAAYNAVFMNENLEYTEDGSALIIPEDILKLSMNDMFGREFDTKEYDDSDDSKCSLVYMLDDKNVKLCLGDWGLVAPRYVVEKVTDRGDGTFTVRVCYLAYDFEEDKPSDNFGMNVEYDCRVSPDTTYGFVIEDIHGEVTSKFW